MNLYLRDPPHDPCAWCEGPVRRLDGEPSDNFRRRKCCCAACSTNRRNDIAAAKRNASAARRAAEAAAIWVDQLPDGAQQGLSGQCFARHEVRVRPQPGRLSRPATVVATGTPLGGE